MQAVEEYLQYERECRKLAAKIVSPEQKRTLEEMAATWARLAAERKAQLASKERARARQP